MEALPTKALHTKRALARIAPKQALNQFNMHPVLATEDIQKLK